MNDKFILNSFLCDELNKNSLSKYSFLLYLLEIYEKEKNFQFRIYKVVEILLVVKTLPS